MNKKKVFIGIVIVVFIIILIIGLVLISHKIFSNQINPSKLEKMEESELINLFNNISKGDKFVNENEKDYRFSYDGADSVEDAIEKTKNRGQSSNTKILELKLQKETDYFYVIYQEYISYSGTKDSTFKNSYLYFKNSIFDIKNKVINTNILNNANKVKKIFNLYAYSKIREIAGTKLLLPEITENSNEYIYSYYCFIKSYGDWGVPDDISLYKYTISIDKQSDTFKSTENKIRQVSEKNSHSLY